MPMKSSASFYSSSNWRLWGGYPSLSKHLMFLEEISSIMVGIVEKKQINKVAQVVWAQRLQETPSQSASKAAVLPAALEVKVGRETLVAPNTW